MSIGLLRSTRGPIFLWAVSLRAAALPSQIAPDGRRRATADWKGRKLTESLRHSRKSKSRLNAARQYQAPVKETVMLDLVFVALGLAAIALMAFYATALRQV
jgi:hypothetical protein